MADYYCSVADVGSRIGLDSSQRSRAESRIERHIRQTAIYIDQTFVEYGREEPTEDTANSTLDGAIDAGATTITLSDASTFSSSGSGNIDGDTFAWTGKSSNDLTGCTGISFNQVYSQEIGLSTFQESAQVIIDEQISQTNIISITLLSSNIQEIIIPMELEWGIRDNERIEAIVITNENNCVLGVTDQSCILINVERDPEDKGINAIQKSTQKIHSFLIVFQVLKKIILIFGNIFAV